MKTIVIGLGNPILTDDAAGILVARMINDMLLNYRSQHNVTVTEAYSGGLTLMDKMEGYERAVIVDSILTGAHPPGKLLRVEWKRPMPTRNSVSMHDSSLEVAVQTGRDLGMSMPGDIRLWGIEALDVETFSEKPTKPVLASLPSAAKEVLADLLGTWPEINSLNSNIIQGMAGFE